MRITLTAYSILRELLPPDSGGKMDVDLSLGATIADLLRQVGLPKEAACAINDSIQRDINTPLHEGDQVSVFRPGSGGEDSANSLTTIGLIAAMHTEAQALLNLVGKWQRIKIGAFRGYRFTVSKWDCILIESGWGAHRAHDATIELINHFNIKFLILFGIAGAVENALQIGDVVEIHSSSMLEENRLSKSQSLSLLSRNAHKAVAQALQSEKAGFYYGTAITTRGSQLVEHPESLEHPVLEMETIGVLQASSRKGVPLISLRAISDGPQSPIPFDLASMMDDDYNLKIGKLIWTVIRHPGLLIQSTKLTQNSTLAEKNAAVAVLAALNHPLTLIQR